MPYARAIERWRPGEVLCRKFMLSDKQSAAPPVQYCTPLCIHYIQDAECAFSAPARLKKTSYVRNVLGVMPVLELCAKMTELEGK